MIANPKYLNQSHEFWATIKLISQQLKYSTRDGLVSVATMPKILETFERLGLYPNKIYHAGQPTELGILILDYLEYRAEILNTVARPNFMKLNEAVRLYEEIKAAHPFSLAPAPMNKQSGLKKGPAFLTCMVNMLIEANIGDLPCKYDASQLTSFTQNKFPVRSLSRRVDGSFPGIINPIAMWEIKEYYYTTSFGSRIADGVYETMLDGYELKEVKQSLNREVLHYMIIDAHDTWWLKGRSYLCRIVDMMHMGLLTECIIGREIVRRIPEIISDWKRLYNQYSVYVDF